MFALAMAVESCKASYKEPFGDDIASVLSWISVPNIDTSRNMVSALKKAATALKAD